MPRIIGYGFDGAFYCVDCAIARKAELNASCECGERDENGLCESNCQGYGPNPAFSTDETPDGYCCDECGIEVGEM
jgi:hypothetical protein